MANRKITAELVDGFIKHFTEDLEKKYGENASLKDIIYHLIDRGVSPTSRVRDFTIIHEFQEKSPSMSTINWTMENETRYDLKDRQIHTVIKKHTLRHCCGKYVTNLP